MTGAHQAILGAARIPASLTYLTTASDTVDRTAYTFSGLSLGDADPSRIIAVVVNCTDVLTVTSVTVAGVSATIHLQATGIFTTCAIATAAVPTGTTGDVVVNLNTTGEDCGVGLWRIVNLPSTTPYDTASNSEDPIVMSIDIPNRGILVAGGTFDQNGAVTTTGCTENYDYDVGTDRFCGGSGSGLTPELNRTITFDGTAGGAAGVAASWAG